MRLVEAWRRRGGRSVAKRFLALSAALASVAILHGATAAEPTPAERADWARSMGQSGLRRFFSTGAELGELVNRQVSYQTAKRIASSAAPPSAASLDLDSYVEGNVVQFDSLLHIETHRDKALYGRALARVANRFEEGKVRSRNDRYDLGLLWALDSRSYLGVGLAAEKTDVDLRYVTGESATDALGLRFDAGFRPSPVLALGLRLEDLRLSGQSSVTVSTANGPLRVDRDIASERAYLQAESILRLTREQLPRLPAGVQLGGVAGLYYLQSTYERRTNSLGQAVTEPFGSRERLGVLRTGGYMSANVGGSPKWNAYAEILFDYEIDTNLDDPIDDRTSTLWRLGLAWLPARGKRVSFDLHRSESRDGRRERDNFLVLMVMDF